MKLNQSFSPSARFATEIRNGMGLAFTPDGKLYRTQHGRDQLHDNWPTQFPTSVDEKKLVTAPSTAGREEGRSVQIEEGAGRGPSRSKTRSPTPEASR